MKNLFYLSSLIILVLSCKNPKGNDFSEINITASVILQEMNELIKVTDTLIKISEPFNINGIKCYWKYKLVLDVEGGELIRELRDIETQRKILKDIDFFYSPVEFDYITFYNIENDFKDVNFNGLKDYIVYNQSKSDRGNNIFSNIYLFNNKIKSFEFSEELSGYNIEIDNVNRMLSSIYGYRTSSQKINRYFDKNGKMKFYEIISEEWQNIDTTQIGINTYEKIMNGKIVETKTDTIKFERQ